MGEIYVARLRGGDRLFALKKVLPRFCTNQEFHDRFVDEARLVLGLIHPNIVRVYEVGQIGRQWYMVMELVDGFDLGSLLVWSWQRQAMAGGRATQVGQGVGIGFRPAGQAARGNRQTLPLGIALHITREVLAALEYCHRQTDPSGKALGVVHRDISPANVLLSFNGRVKVTDFGLAASSKKIVKTLPHVVMGKPGYIAPERLNGEAVDARADLYNVGILMFELLTSSRFSQAGDEPRLQQDLERELMRLGVTTIVRDVLTRALAVDCEDRFQSATEYGQAIEELIEQVAPGVGSNELAALMQASSPRRKRAAGTVCCDAPTEKRSSRRRASGQCLAAPLSEIAT